MRSANISTSPAYNEFTSWDHEAVLTLAEFLSTFYWMLIRRQNCFKTGIMCSRLEANRATNSSDMTSNFFLSAGIASTEYNYKACLLGLYLQCFTTLPILNSLTAKPWLLVTQARTSLIAHTFLLPSNILLVEDVHLMEQKLVLFRHPYP